VPKTQHIVEVGTKNHHLEDFQYFFLMAETYKRIPLD